MAKIQKQNPWGEVIGEEIDELGGQAWVRETGIVAGPHSIASMKADHTGAAGLRFRLYPWSVGLGNVTSSFGAAVDHYVTYFTLYQTDVTPASAMVLVTTFGIQTGGGAESQIPGGLEIQTDGTVNIIRGDYGGVLHSFTPPWVANAHYAVQIAIDIDASDDVRLRIWIVPADKTSWGPPVFDQTYVTTTATSIVNWPELNAYNYKGGTIPGTIWYFDDGWGYGYDTADDSDLQPGPYKYAVDVPTGNSATNVSFDQGTGAFDYLEVDEPLTAAPNDADYTESDTGATGLKTETYIYTPTTKVPVGSKIHCVNAVTRASYPGAGGGAKQVAVRDGGVNTFIGAGAGAGFENLHWTMLVAPTSGAWTIALADALETGARKTATLTSQIVRMSRVYKGFGFTKSGSLVVPNRSAIRTLVAR